MYCMESHHPQGVAASVVTHCNMLPHIAGCMDIKLWLYIRCIIKWYVILRMMSF